MTCVQVAARQDLRQRALAGAVRPHDGMHFAGIHGEIDALENFPAGDCSRVDF